MRGIQTYRPGIALVDEYKRLAEAEKPVQYVELSEGQKMLATQKKRWWGQILGHGQKFSRQMTSRPPINFYG